MQSIFRVACCMSSKNYSKNNRNIIIIIVSLKKTSRIPDSTLLLTKALQNGFMERKWERRKLGAGRLKVGTKSQEGVTQSINNNERLKF